MARPVATEHTGLPLKKGRAGTMTHDYKRHGTTTLVAALNVLGRQGHRSQHATASASGVHPLPQRRRGGGSCEQGGSCDSRQLRSAQASKRRTVDRAPCAGYVPQEVNPVSESDL